MPVGRGRVVWLQGLGLEHSIHTWHFAVLTCPLCLYAFLPRLAVSRCRTTHLTLFDRRSFFHRRSLAAARRCANTLRELASIAERRADGMMHPAALRRMADADTDRHRARDLRDVARASECVAAACGPSTFYTPRACRWQR